MRDTHVETIYKADEPLVLLEKMNFGEFGFTLHAALAGTLHL